MLKRELQKILEDKEPFSKKIKIADNAYKSSLVRLGKKEVFLLKWIIKQHNEESWQYINKWFNCEQFKKINKNDVNREDFTSIIELINKKILLTHIIEKSTMRIILESVLLMIQNNVFQNYFKYDIEIFCKLISTVLHKINCQENLKEFLDMDVFNKNLLAHEKFHKNFFALILPRLVECLHQFSDIEVFNYISKFIQKCLFYKNQRSMKTFIYHFFGDVQSDEKKTVAKYLFKYIVCGYRTDEDAVTIFKIIFHAFCATYRDFELIYKFFILLVHTIGFDLKDIFISSKITKLELTKSELSLTKSQEILLILIDVLSETKNDLSFKINDITFSEFIRNILKQLLFFGIPSPTSYNIFLKAIAVDPLLIEPITDDIIIYSIILDNHKSKLFEHMMISILDIYSKLRRVEHFISKMVHTLGSHFNGNRKTLEQIYKFNGEVDMEAITAEENIVTENIFTDKILQHFSKCICNLASWQIINIFKTLLFQMQQIMNHMDKNEQLENFMEIMSVLLSIFLCSVRLAEHTVVTNIVEKLVKALEELKIILRQFGCKLLNRHHNQKLMRSFLNIAYNWAEVHISLEYYCSTQFFKNKIIDNDSTACNVTYLHSYLTVKQWCLISERITNFGEVACKQLLEKLYVQKLRAMLLFEKSITEDVLQNVVKSISENIEFIWMDIIRDRYVINNLLPRMDPSYIIFLAEKCMAKKYNINTLFHNTYIKNSVLFVKALNYTAIMKINTLLTKKMNEGDNDILNKVVSNKICSLLNEDIFFSKVDPEIINEVTNLLYSNSKDDQIIWNINEEKINFLFQIVRKVPLIFGDETVQKICLIYFCSLHRDLAYEFKQGNYKKLQDNCERLIIGILQYCKFKLGDLFTTAHFWIDIVENYDEWELIFSLVTENIFRDEYSIEIYAPILLYFIQHLHKLKYMRSCIIIANRAVKIKKIKISKKARSIAEKYKSMICDNILDVVAKRQYTSTLISGYALALKHFLANNEKEKLSKLLISLNVYLDLALTNTEDPESNLMLLVTILENKSVVGGNYHMKIWDACKEKDWIYSKTDKLEQLVKLIFGVASNEEFVVIVRDLFKGTEESIANKSYDICAKRLKLWESALTCNINSIKINCFQTSFEKLLQILMITLQNCQLHENLYLHVFYLQKTAIHVTYFPLNSNIVDMVFLSLILLNEHLRKNEVTFNLSITLLESLLKYRKPFVMDRLPCFLQLYRILLNSICERSNTDLDLIDSVIKEVSDHSHELEKLTKNLVLCQKDMSRIAMYLIADILQQYEQITLHPNVKIHLNNCIYSLLTICDQHAVAFLGRTLSSASTEIFKDLYDNYKRFYRFTGKV